MSQGELDATKSTNSSAEMYKRERKKDEVSQQAGESSGIEERPIKSRKLTSENEADIDPVAMARRALEMYKNEVQDDGDFEEPNTTPADLPSTGVEKKPFTSTEATKSSTSKVDETASSRWLKVGRQPMISQDDDPSIL